MDTPRHKYPQSTLHTGIIRQACEAGRVPMTLGAWIALDCDPACWLYNEQNAELGLEPWREVEPDTCTNESGAYIGNTIYSSDCIVFVSLRDLMGRKPYAGKVA